MPAGAPPDPSHGVFSTLLVLDGDPIELDAHLRRLDSSLADVYGERLPAAALSLVRERCDGLAHGRLRLTARPRRDGGAGVVLAAEAAAVDPAATFPSEAGAALRGHSLPGGLGAHKWVDRSALPAAGANPAPLLLGARGEAMEAAWANLFAVREGALLTPPLDGRILPGIARERTIEAARELGIEVREEPLAAAALPDADEVLLSNCVRGLEAPASLDGAPLPGAGSVAARLAEALRALWRLGAPVASRRTALAVPLRPRAAAR